MLNHDYENAIVDSTCEEQGYVIQTCKNCHIENILEYIPATGHDYNLKEETEQYKEFECANCGKSYKEYVPCEVTHDYQVKTTTDEYIEYECSSCKNTYKEYLQFPNENEDESNVDAEF